MWDERYDDHGRYADTMPLSYPRKSDWRYTAVLWAIVIVILTLVV